MSLAASAGTVNAARTKAVANSFMKASHYVQRYITAGFVLARPVLFGTDEGAIICGCPCGSAATTIKVQ
jgi:hypothetical protein